MGGVVRLWAIPPKDITINGNSAVLSSFDNVIEINMTQDTAGATILPATSFAGTTYKHEITGFIPGFESDTEAIIKDMMRQRRFVVFYMDSNGDRVLLGRPEIPIRFNAEFSTGLTPAEPRGYKISFSGNVHYPPVRLLSDPND